MKDRDPAPQHGDAGASGAGALEPPRPATPQRERRVRSRELASGPRALFPRAGTRLATAPCLFDAASVERAGSAVEAPVDAVAPTIQAAIHAVTAPIELAVDAIPAAVETTIDAVALPLEPLGPHGVAIRGRSVGPTVVAGLDAVALAVEAAVHPVAPPIELAFDAVASAVETMVDAVAAAIQAVRFVGRRAAA